MRLLLPVSGRSDPSRPVSYRLKGKQMNDFWDFFWLLIWTYLFVAYLVVLFQIIGDVFRDRDLGGFAKALWMIALILVPFLSRTDLPDRAWARDERAPSRPSRQGSSRDGALHPVCGEHTQLRRPDRLSQGPPR